MDTAAGPVPPQPAHDDDEARDEVAALPRAAAGDADAAARMDDERDETTTAVDEVLVPYTFGRTPSLKLDVDHRLPLASRTVRPRLEHRTSSHSSYSSSIGIAAPPPQQPSGVLPAPRPYALPPGLAHSPQPPPLASPGLASYSPTGPFRTVAPPSTRPVQPFPRSGVPSMAAPRSARISYEPPIPLDVQILLLTTPPPPAPASRTSLSSVSSRASTLARSDAQAYRDELLAAERARRAREDKRLAGKARRLLSGSVSYLSGGGGGTAGRRGEDLAGGTARDDDAGVPTKAFESLDLNRSRGSRDSRRGAGRIDSTTAVEFVPKTWDEYTAAYAAGQLDLEDPPFPPLGALLSISATFPSAAAPHRAGAASLSPYEAAHFPAPLHLSPVTPTRERLLAQLDLLGETYLLPSASAVPLHVSTTTGSPVPSLPSAGSSVTSGRRDSLVQSVHAAAGRRASNASTAPSTTHSGPSPATKGGAIFPSSSYAPPPSSPAMMVNAQPYGQHLSHAPPVDAISAMTLRNHPALLTLLRRALYAPLGSQALFKPAPKAAIITLFPTAASSHVTILASVGLPTRTTTLPVSHALDAHVLLAGERGLVVPDTERDWRFRGNEVVCKSPSNPMSGTFGASPSGLGIRFFAGVPIFAPSLPSLAGFEEEAGGRIAIGTVSLLDDWPRTSKFGSSDRANLRSLASQVTHEIDRFLREREQHRFARRTSVSSTVASASALGAGGGGGNSAVSQTTARTATRERARKAASGGSGVERAGEGGHVSWDGRRGSTSGSEREGGPAAPAPTAPLPTPPPSTGAGAHASPVADTSSSSVFATACTSLAQSLDLSLVYVVSLDLASCAPAPSIVGKPALTLVAAHNLPSDSNASFDPALHLRALRAPEGGLLYRSPTATAAGEGAQATGAGGFASGILLPVAESTETGYVLAGYTTERGRKWGEAEMGEFDKVRDRLASVVPSP
ncbi:hypothetical protein JCM3775_001702 [Rhodotorula graminis]